MTMLACLGLGYCARFYVAEFGARFDRVIGTSRSAGKKAGGSIELPVFDGVRASPQLREAVSNASDLLISAAPGDGGDPVLAAFANDIAVAPKLQSIVYLSSLGVYGDH